MLGAAKRSGKLPTVRLGLGDGQRAAGGLLRLSCMGGGFPCSFRKRERMVLVVPFSFPGLELGEQGEAGLPSAGCLREEQPG